MGEKAGEVNLDFESCTELRLKIVPVYQAMINKIDAHALIGTAPEFATTVTEINTQVVIYNLD